MYAYIVINFHLHLEKMSETLNLSFNNIFSPEEESWSINSMHIFKGLSEEGSCKYVHVQTFHTRAPSEYPCLTCVPFHILDIIL